MRLKSYFSGTVEAAMALARKEMGDDAMLIHSRPAQPEARHLGAYEVVFGTYNGDSGGSHPSSSLGDRQEVQTQRQPAPLAESGSPQGGLAEQVTQLRQEMERMLRSLVRQNSLAVPQEPGPQPAVLELPHEPPSDSLEYSIYQWLVDQELATSLAREAASGRAWENLFHVNSTLGRDPGPSPKPAIVALIGPPGAGKTTTLAKLAARYGPGSRKRAHILSADVLRIGAADQLRTLASLLGIGFGVAESPVELDRMIEEQYNKDLILIDTPGLGKADLEDGRELAHMIGSDPEIDTHLVLPASMKPVDLARQVDLFREFRPRKLIFTRLDETSRFGALLNLASSTGLEVSFLTQGQRIPDDLEAASSEGLVKLLAIPPHLQPVNQPVLLGRGAAA